MRCIFVFTCRLNHCYLSSHHPTLDDDFFSIDDFNRETEEMESRHRSKGSLSRDDDDEEDEEELDFFKPLDDATSNEIFEEEDEENGGFSDLCTSALLLS